jgi:hypothetical protein
MWRGLACNGAIVVLLAFQPAAAVALPDYGPAYRLALRCFIVNADIDDDSGAKLAFDAAMKLGRMQGFDNVRLNHDLDAATATELVRLKTENGYREHQRAMCTRAGMVGT